MTLGQGGTGSNGNEGVLPELELYYQMQLRVIPRAQLIEGVLHSVVNTVRVYLAVQIS